MGVAVDDQYVALDVQAGRRLESMPFVRLDPLDITIETIVPIKTSHQTIQVRPPCP